MILRLPGDCMSLSAHSSGLGCLCPTFIENNKQHDEYIHCCLCDAYLSPESSPPTKWQIKHTAETGNEHQLLWRGGQEGRKRSSFFFSISFMKEKILWIPHRVALWAFTSITRNSNTGDLAWPLKKTNVLLGSWGTLNAVCLSLFLSWNEATQLWGAYCPQMKPLALAVLRTT